jgi:hypothetical protein
MSQIQLPSTDVNDREIPAVQGEMPDLTELLILRVRSRIVERRALVSF